ncbi:MAG: SGNH/GDSL hydrolase family protein [Candidatus Eremiobacteraeota bacterium]|nr:SGNH/GDSL hydrolase family protein [Candidatus Eremiobacteraeota bacterium]
MTVPGVATKYAAQLIAARMKTRLALLAIAILLSSSRSADATGQAKLYLAFGTSETVGVGIPPGGAYPLVFARQCGLSPFVIASPGASNVPAWPDRLPRIFSLFISPNYVLFRRMRTNERRLTALLVEAHRRRVPGIIVLPPATSRLAAFMPSSRDVADEEEMRRYIRTLVNDSLRLIDLSTLPRDSRDLLRDGLHPSIRGQARIAAELYKVARSMKMCERMP